jgi:hypothetical protein
MKTKFLHGCILLFCYFAPGLRAQDTEFWFVVAQVSTTNTSNYPAFLAISNASGKEAHVTITRYNGGNPIVDNATISGSGGFYKLDFPDANAMKTIENPRDQAGSVTEFGIHIHSDVKVSAYYMLNYTYSKDIYTLKGHQALGTLFYVPMQSDNAAKANAGPIGQGNWAGYDFIDIVATEDDTEVTVEPKAAIRIGISGSSAAGTPVTRTLDKGETLKIMENTQDAFPSLAGTKITSTKPIAITVTEDMVAGDNSGDQIVPVNSLGTRYIVPKGYLNGQNPALVERFYVVATEDNTTVTVYADTQTTLPDITITLNLAGDVGRYSLPSGAEAVYVKASAPVYLYQRTGFGEEGAALLPSFYAIGQTELSFHQADPGSAVDNNGPIQRGFLIFRDGAESGFTISYGIGGTFSPLSLTPLDIPNNADWKIARFNLNNAPSGGQVVRLRNTQSAFAVGYITGHQRSDNCYGYYTAFSFELPDTTYMCTTNPSVTLKGAYAMSYEWRYNGSVISTSQSVTVTQEGEYTLVMNQDPTIVTLTTFVSMINAGTICPDTVICTGTSALLNVSGASGDTFQWQVSSANATWANIAGATSPTYTTGALTQPAWYRRKTGANDCQMLESGSTRVGISSCTLPVNPHLMGRFRGN